MKVKALCHLIAGLAVAAAFVPVTMAQPLPDLTINDLTVNEKCQIVVTIKNNGPGQLPTSAFSSGSAPSLRLYQDNAAHGFWSMSKQELKPAGGTYVFIVLAANSIVSGTQNIRAVIDENNVVNEANENNNSMQRTLTCTPKLPDLVIEKIGFAADCRTTITVKNIGDGEIPANSFDNILLSRTVDGQDKGWFRLSQAGKAVCLPGGKVVWTDFAEFKAKKTLKYQVSGLPIEKNSTNNSAVADVPSRCTEEGHKLPTPVQNLPSNVRKKQN